MNRFFILALIAALCGSGAAHAQDILTLRSGEELKVVVSRVTQTDVMFKMYNDPQGSTFSYPKSQVTAIVYRDGRREVFNSQYNNQPQYSNQQQPQYGNQQQQYGNRQQNSNQQQQYGNQPQYGNRQSYGNQPQYRNQPGNYSSGWRKFTVGLSFPDVSSSSRDFNDSFGKGVGIGLKSYRPLDHITPHLSLVYGAELYYHGLSSDVKDKLYPSNADVTYPMFFNLPVTIGGNYAIRLPNSNASIYGEAAAGLNVSYITKIRVEYNRGGYEEISFDPAFEFCYGLEAGIFFNNQYSIGVRYNNLGAYRYKAKYKDSDGYTDTDRLPKIELKNTVLVFGIRF